MKHKGIFILLSILAASSIAGIGISIAEESILAVVFCIVALVVIMGSGFSLKRRLRERGEL
ncbi:YlaF family protein [Peribacillus kribbensis]|uniref:YlaF family protein n=1 Tax=Peribacillus kribbensis TaxID=356658 RepID=UPI00041583B0|nr:YlaF family protein [Peribacillus kribbensis]